MLNASMPWVSLFVLGAAHGINPAMGWLFAVGRGLQERDRRAVWRALGPLAIGHVLAICVAVIAAVVLGKIVPLGWVRWAIALSLLTIGIDGLRRHRHVRLGGMRANGFELATWSFLMATAHGAGLMVLPFIAGSLAPAAAAHHHHAPAGVAAGFSSMAVAAPLAHTLGYLALTVILAVVVYEKVGLRILRRAWINVNLLWSGALIVAAFAAVLS
jgi:hypothetical protein